MTIYDFIVQDKDGKKVSLSEYKGKTGRWYQADSLAL